MRKEVRSGWGAVRPASSWEDSKRARPFLRTMSSCSKDIAAFNVTLFPEESVAISARNPPAPATLQSRTPFLRREVPPSAIAFGSRRTIGLAIDAILGSHAIALLRWAIVRFVMISAARLRFSNSVNCFGISRRESLSTASALCQRANASRDKLMMMVHQLSRRTLHFPMGWPN